jgi:hypothetical protein
MIYVSYEHKRNCICARTVKPQVSNVLVKSVSCVTDYIFDIFKHWTIDKVQMLSGTCIKVMCYRIDFIYLSLN